MKLGVNIDHVATLREVRKGIDPEPVLAAIVCEASGADSIVAHLREDRRHIKEPDLLLLKKTVRTRLNLEMSVAGEIVAFACRLKPNQATLVPERRQELTTEGGLDVCANLKRIKQVREKLEDRGIVVSLFIDPEKRQIDAAKRSGVEMIELHTGRYADAKRKNEQNKYFQEILMATRYAKTAHLTVNAGHGLNYHNVSRIAGIKGIEELNIGYSIVCRAVMVGLAQAIKEIKKLIKEAKG
ncbi:MAG: pyridoxine 5'-phosphate synthase [Omnitrophica WOR_2 bacterium SM23_72]|nr:MAG: pyridoxine 5'-phosphate synthase [Omnitrophica WOR_2 bacterium SM23_72]